MQNKKIRAHHLEGELLHNASKKWVEKNGDKSLQEKQRAEEGHQWNPEKKHWIILQLKAQQPYSFIMEVKDTLHSKEQSNKKGMRKSWQEHHKKKKKLLICHLAQSFLCF